ncbi:immunity protein YezG family protein [Metabacillus idriensis]|uniref:immunity protein YezG family protein n=1 Tax=Metabacillus idriensis TaxID=324768 RepID=UPI00398FF835
MILIEFEQYLNSLYQQIAQQINDMIPVEWDEIYFNGEVKDGEGGVYFFFSTPDDKGVYKYSHFIPRLYDVDKRMYNKFLHELFELTDKLQKVFINNDQEPWFSVTMIVNSEGKLKVHFDYINWTKSEFGPSDRVEYFQYKYFDRKSEHEKNRELINKMQQYEEKFTNI